ncbi:Fms-interacting protein-domain-containing protein [Clohesyomyces aquaticus]|uniref:Fms-interacting protein-domain-containing protein n=1 Tax=Clohesyomyces aquaticus TaxID=1231657 RepID=A0A1Y2A1F0_9PLEO|nr:Fms-interacting protein-domain-containing protein [Clohesyomyces aquaticus]
MEATEALPISADVPDDAVAGAGAIDDELQAIITNFKPSDYVQTPHNKRVLEENQKLRTMIHELAQYKAANPKKVNPVTRKDIDHERAVEAEILQKKKMIKAQLAVVKSAFRQSAVKIRDEKRLTAESREVNDSLVLKLHNLKYEAESLEKEISAARNYDHKYAKLPLIPIHEFLQLFPERAGASEQELMAARIDHEYQVRVKSEERRQEKLKQKQLLISEVKKKKDELTKLDEMLEKFIEAAKPIQEVLEKE